MKKAEFIEVVLTISDALKDLVNVSKKGEHCLWCLGDSCLPGTYRHAEILWRKYGTLSNLIILYDAKIVQERLDAAGVVHFYAVPPKSKRCCRRRMNFKYVHGIR